MIGSIDGATGAVIENAEVVFTAEGQEVFVCPTWHGGKDWEAGAYSPRTNLMYMPLRNTCARMMATRTFPEDTPVGRNEARSPCPETRAPRTPSMGPDRPCSLDDWAAHLDGRDGWPAQRPPGSGLR